MWSRVVLYLMLLHAASVCSPGSYGTDSLAEKGQAELFHVRRLANQPRYGKCWARALVDIEASCRELTEERQSRMALKFTHCHLHRSGREFPACPEGAELSECTADMDAVAFNAFTEFFTHTLSICHFLQSEAWQLRAETSMHSLTEASASVAEQLSSTRLLTEDLLEAQSSALLAQDQILLNGQELQHTIRESSQGVRELFSQVTDSSREQQVVLSELFHRISFLQSFVLLEAHTLSSGLYNAAGLCTAFLLTCTPHTARSRLVLLGLVCVNVCLERLIYQYVMDSSNPAYPHMELVTQYVAVLRRIMGTLGVLILVLAALRYRDPTQDSLLVLAQLRDTQHSLQLALTHTERRRSRSGEEDMWRRKEVLHTLPRPCYHDDQINRRRESRRQEHVLRPPTNSDLSHRSEKGPLDTSTESSQNTLLLLDAPPPRRTRSQRYTRPAPLTICPAPEVYSILVEEGQPRYRLRSRLSETHNTTHNPKQ
ncbi:uncharacterized protein LOC132462614 isoform X3 [Gadus macrocephalus]|uniref:uncharacterized protein LOC132462614 isoform X3 n=1 Tax=Gadus macrocephalus TaxID=80720 RepID=UPI0028CB8607|nr:uncharacterized protein LOC132462614 isoform X3 [Gadus macrocephalus]